MSEQQRDTNTKIAFLVYIVESPSSLDLYHKRSEGEILCKALTLAEIPSSLKLTVDMKAFFASLTIGLQKYLEQAEALPPILHLSSHGNINGLQLTSEEMIEWKDLRDLIVPINNALKGNLILCISSCEGFSGCRMALTEGDIPFFGLISNYGKPAWSDTAIAFATFYHLLAKGHSILDAVEAMKVASGNKGFIGIRGSEAKQIYIEEIKKLQINIILESLKQNALPVPESKIINSLKKSD